MCGTSVVFSEFEAHYKPHTCAFLYRWVGDIYVQGAKVCCSGQQLTKYIHVEVLHDLADAKG